MTTELLDIGALPAACVRMMSIYLQTDRLALRLAAGSATRGQAELLGVPSEVEIIGAARDSRLVVLCARPGAPWSFGSCFPQMASYGTSGEADALQPSSLLPTMALSDSLWMFVYTDHPDQTELERCLATSGLYTSWCADHHHAFAQLGLTLEDDPFDTSLASLLDFDRFSTLMPPPSQRAAVRPVQGGFFMWGIPVPAGTAGSTPSTAAPSVFESVHTLLAEIPGGSAATRAAEQAFMVKAGVHFHGPFPDLVLQMPAASWEVGPFENANLFLASPLHYASSATAIGIHGEFKLDDNKRIELELDYQIDGDLIFGCGRYVAGAGGAALLDTSALGLPGTPTFSPQVDLELDLVFSKSRRSLRQIAFTASIESEHWTLLSAPVALSLNEVSFAFSIDDPLGTDRAVSAEITAMATLGSGPDAVRLECGGSYPRGDLFLRALDPIPLGGLLQMMGVEGEGLQDYTIDDLAVGYNYRSGHLALEFELPKKWEVFHGFELDDVRFAIHGGQAYTALFAASLQIGGVHVGLTAAYDDGWDLAGSAEQLPLGRLIAWLAAKIAPGFTIPDELGSFVIDQMTLRAHSKTQRLAFTCSGSLHLEHGDAEAAITISRGSADEGLQLGGQLTIAGRQFDLHCHKDPTSSRVLLSCHSDGERVELRSLVGGDIGQQIPAGLAVTFKDVFIAYAEQSASATAGSDAFKGFLLGADLDATIRLSDIPLAGASLPSGFDAGVDGLRIVLASHDFTASQLVGLNADLPPAIAILERTADPTAAAAADGDPLVIAKGFNLTAQLRLGEVTRTLNLNTASSPSAKAKASTDLAAAPTPAAAQLTAPDSHAATPTPPAGAEVDTVSARAIPPATPGKGGDGAAWVTLDKKLGPVEFRRIGLQYQDKALWVLLDVAFSSSGLTLSLDGLGVGSPLSEFKPEFKLSGIGIDYSGGGGVEIGGAFLREELKDKKGDTYTQYSGAALIKTDALKLSAIGSYAEVGGHTSMFVYAFLDKPIGGPSFFFVTGIAAGFGYNRDLKSPSRVEDVASFPLVAIAMGTHPVADHNDETRALLDILASLAPYLPPAPGKCFLALGVKFNSFKLIDSFALLIVSFGDEVRVKLLGLSKIVAPAAISGKPPVAEVTIGLIAEFIPADGLLKVDGKIMPGSYVLDHACQLSGGFAFYSWFSGPHGGDFVLSVGGYHPRFVVPAHYPAIDRLALNWQIDEHLSVKGSTYFALTSSAVMAGGMLEARLDKGNLQAWFDLNADMLICWQPFHYDIEVSIEIGASYHTFLGTISASLGAAVHIWGPEFAGTANVHFVFISFDVSFGAVGLQKPPTLGWTEFKTAFLPADAEVCTISVADGLQRTLKQSPDENVPAKAPEWHLVTGDDFGSRVDIADPAATASADRWVIDAKHFAMTVESRVPLNAATADGTAAGALGIASMGLGNFASTMHLALARRDPDTGQFLDCCNEFRLVPIVKSVPSALWGRQAEPELNGRPIPGAVCGFEVRPKAHPEPGNSQDIRCSALAFNCTDAAALDWEPAAGLTSLGPVTTLPGMAAAAQQALRDLFACDDDGDPFDLEIDSRLIGEFLEPPQLVSTPGH